MIVPSRSIKTAADSSLAMLGVLLETGYQCISCHRCCSKLADHDSARVICDFRCFGWGRAASQAECKKSDGCITRARNIENLSRLGGDVVWHFLLLKKHHAVFTESDKDIFCFPFFKQHLTSAFQIRILGWNSIGIAAGNTCSEKSFTAIRLDYR